MPLKTPPFWAADTALSRLLVPLSWLYALGRGISVALARPYTSALPVLCIGGVVAGGSGKTPVTHAVARLVRERGLFRNPVILTRGYGGSLKGPTTVDLSCHTAADVGDEAMLHAAVATTIVSRDRADGARLAELAGADLIILDDGLQNTSLAKTWAFLVVDSAQGVGNGRLLPAGPLRESLKAARLKSTAVIYTGGTGSLSPSFSTTLSVVDGPDRAQTYVAFAGLGRPEKFRKTLEDNGYNLAAFVPFPDHHVYTAAEMETLLLEGHPLVTTAKDHVRVPAPYRDRVSVLQIEIAFDAPDDFLASWVPA